MIILMTACIQPPCDGVCEYVKNADIRLAQYLEALNYYISCNAVEGIVICDNSNYSIRDNDIAQHVSNYREKPIEIISFDGNGKTIIQGKGYGEGEIIEYAINNSKLIKKTGTFLKVTGRLKVLNLDALAIGMSEEKNYFIRDIYNGWDGIDTRLFFCQVDFYLKCFKEKYTRVDDSSGYTLERVFYNQLRGKHNFRSFRFYPHIEGMSAGNGIDYRRMSVMKRTFLDALCFVNLFNTVAPLFHITKIAKRKTAFLKVFLER